MSENELRDRAYKIACDHGWHDELLPDTHWVMMIITEMAEAVQADRKDKHADREQYLLLIDKYLKEDGIDKETLQKFKQIAFDDLIKDSFEDELADICIRCYDLAGLRNFNFKNTVEIDITQGRFEDILSLPVPQFMNYVIRCISTVYKVDFDMINFALYMIAEYAGTLNIPLMWYIKEKMNYNEKRPYKHGRKY